MFCFCELTQENYKKHPTSPIVPIQFNPPKNCNSHLHLHIYNVYVIT